ncbi:MAG: sigma-70 family RNA polymerase sigma factor [Archangium sp.]
MADALEPVLRHAYGRVVASLMRQFGASRLALVEDGVAQAMLEAVTSWRARGVPPNAHAWLFRAARNRVIDELRRNARLEDEPLEEDVGEIAPDEPALGDDVHDDELRALLSCADADIPLASQIAFALRTLCGFSTKEIANRLVTTEANVQKRWERARDVLAQKERGPAHFEPERVQAVLRMIYVLFTEGYFASEGEQVLRLELCREALRLGRLIADHPRATCREAWALLALMHFHHARRDARADADGSPVLLEEQDRTRYRRDELAVGMDAFQRSEPASLDTRYHLEAAIAAEHAFAPRFEDIRWNEIVALYGRLAVIDPSPLHELHAAIAVSWAEGPAAALPILDALRPPTWLSASHLWLAVYADLYRRLGERARAREFYEKAVALAPPLERAVLQRRLRGIE